jgi:hypothetical protein
MQTVRKPEHRAGSRNISIGVGRFANHCYQVGVTSDQKLRHGGARLSFHTVCMINAHAVVAGASMSRNRSSEKSRLFGRTKIDRGEQGQGSACATRTAASVERFSLRPPAGKTKAGHAGGPPVFT